MQLQSIQLLIMKNFVFSFLLCVIFGANFSTSSDDLKFLDLSNKALKSLNQYNFAQYPQLEEIDLSHNQLTVIPEDVFKKNNNLKKLNLSYNQKLILPQFSTILIAGIEEINLSNCNITEVPENLFDGLTKLQIINLDQNPLSELHVFPLSNIETVRKIIIPGSTKFSAKELCHEVPNLTIEVHRKKNKRIIHCSDEQVKSNDEFQSEEVEYRKRDVQSVSNSNDSTPLNQTEEKIESTTQVEVTVDLEETPKVVVDHQEEKVVETNSTNANATAPPPEPPIEQEKNVETTATETPTTTSSTLETTEHQQPIEAPPPMVETPKEQPPLVRKVDIAPENITDHSPMVKMSGTGYGPEISDLNKPLDLEDKPEPSKALKPISAGSNILIGLVVAVIVLGATAFAYKLYKTRNYRAARTEEPPARELDEIKVHTTPPAEAEPLMHLKHGNKTDETNGQQNGGDFHKSNET